MDPNALTTSSHFVHRLRNASSHFLRSSTPTFSPHSIFSTSGLSGRGSDTDPRSASPISRPQ